MRTISSRQNSLVKLFKAAARVDSGGETPVLLEGLQLVVDADAAGVGISHAVFSTESLTPDLRRLARRLEQRGADVASASTSVLEALSPAGSPSGVVGLARRPVYHFDDALTRAPQLVLAALDVQDPGNVGALVRSAEAAGASGVMVCGASADPFGWKAIRGSMGSVFRLPTLKLELVAEAVHAARRHHLQVLTTAPRHGRPVFDIDLTRPTMFIVGGEGSGLAPEVLQAADQTVTIPMTRPVESLNVGVAGALLLYEAFRQRQSTEKTRGS